MSKEIKKVIDGRMQLGIVIDWLYKNHTDMSIGEKSVYTTIAVGSLQRFHKKSPNIKMSDFSMDKKTLHKYREALVAKGLIRYKRTKAYTAYWLLQPNEELSRFFYGGENSSIQETKEVKKTSLDLFR